MQVAIATDKYTLHTRTHGYTIMIRESKASRPIVSWRPRSPCFEETLPVSACVSSSLSWLVPPARWRPYHWRPAHCAKDSACQINVLAYKAQVSAINPAANPYLQLTIALTARQISSVKSEARGSPSCMYLIIGKKKKKKFDTQPNLRYSLSGRPQYYVQ